MKATLVSAGDCVLHLAFQKSAYIESEDRYDFYDIFAACSDYLDDADISAVAGATAFAACMHAGQGCAITTRLLVPRDRYDDAVQVAAATMETIGAKDPAVADAICGPLISAAQRDRVAEYLKVALAEGGTFATGGHVIEQAGYWIAPTVVAGLDNSSRLAQEEICLLYTSPSPRDRTRYRMPSSA